MEEEYDDNDPNQCSLTLFNIMHEGEFDKPEECNCKQCINP